MRALRKLMLLSLTTVSKNAYKGVLSYSFAKYEGFSYIFLVFLLMLLSPIPISFIKNLDKLHKKILDNILVAQSSDNLSKIKFNRN